jgi:superfamily I DNA and/or RNA helicase
VALTRAKLACWVVGHVPTLATSAHWRAFIGHAQATGCLMDVPNAAVVPTSL